MTSTPTHNSPDIDPTVSTGDEACQELPPTTSAQPIKVVSTQVLQTQRVAVVTLLLLIVLCVMWELVWAPIKPGGSWLALKALPLVLPLAGFLKRRLYTFRWVSLVIWLYFIEGVVRAYSDPWPINVLALAELSLCLILFFSCALHVRYRFAAAKAQSL